MSEKVAAERLALGVLISGRGSNLAAILRARQEERLDADVRLVISNVAEAAGLSLASAAGVPTAVVSHRAYPKRSDFEQELLRQLRQHGVEWVALAGFMRVLTGTFLAAFPGRVVNIHPALLPAFPGVAAAKQALDYGVKVSGCTVHLVDEGTDTGPIIAQATVAVAEEDDEASLSRRILQEEHRLYPEALQLLCEGRTSLEGRRVRILPKPAKPNRA